MEKKKKKNSTHGKLLTCSLDRWSGNILDKCLVAQSCPTLCNPVDCSLSDTSVHGDSPGRDTFSRTCFAMSSSRGPPIQGSNPDLPHWRWILYHLNHQESPSCIRGDNKHILMSYKSVHAFLHVDPCLLLPCPFILLLLLVLPSSKY